jgi:mRNA-degrading endonuclease RelE of RelBE toxin-antitoxin system
MKVIFFPRAEKELSKLDKSIQQRIISKLDKIARSPNLCRHLSALTDVKGYKIRVGDYRIFVDPDFKEDALNIHKIKHRKNAYKEL